AFLHLRLDGGEHRGEALRIFARQGHYAGGAFRVEIERSGAICRLLPLLRDVEARSARRFLRLRDGVILRAIEEVLRGMRLQNAGRGAFYAHGESIAIGQSAADREAWHERILGYLHAESCAFLAEK